MTTERVHRPDENPLIQQSKIRAEWVTEVDDYMNDEDFTKVLDLAVQVMSGDIPEQAKIARICARLEAYAIKFRMQFTAYMSYKKGTTEANMKKNHYKELYTGVDKLVDSLKYMMK